MNNPQPEHEKWKWTHREFERPDGTVLFRSMLSDAQRVVILEHVELFPISESNAQSIVTAHNVMPEVVEVIEDHIEMLRAEYSHRYHSRKYSGAQARMVEVEMEAARDLLKRIGGGE